MSTPDEPEFDAIVIGTGFAGAVTACRLVQAGQRICVLERGRRYGPDDLPVYSDERSREDGPEGDECGSKYVQPDLSRLLWKLGQGLWDVRSLGGVVVGQAAGYGGGSLIYANVHLRAPASVFERHWPPEYTHKSLDDYYDLAAFMLDVTPLPRDITLPKTSQLERAARGCERDSYFFRPPLAVRFEGAAPPREGGPPQGTCNMCGGCTFGCKRQAKNTLDLNYLALAEKAVARDGRGELLADIRTLAEVVSIESLGGGPANGYRVRYEDRLLGGKPESVTARYVFLCAGAVNTTELLLRSRGQLPIAEGKELGDRYHPNADAVAAVFDCDEPQEADRGPTITGALLHSDGKHWLMVQDGGMPAALEPLLGFFRSPLWTRRNRHREGPTSLKSRPAVARLAEPPFRHLLDVLSGLTRSALRPGLSQTRAVFEFLMAERPIPDAGKRWKGSSDQLDRAREAIRRELLDDLVSAAEPAVEDFLVKSADRIEREYDLEQLLFRALPLRNFDARGIADLHLPRQVLQLGMQLVWGSQGALVRAIANDLLAKVVPGPGDLVEQASLLLRWALDYRLADGHTALLLCMGRDSGAGRLSLERVKGRGAQGALRATLPRPDETPERSVQERLLRDLAASWDGELRMDPSWCFLGRRVTVHSQGGCAMATATQPGVTRADGQVLDCPGLYVMDAAAFPTSVGVNPSATIAAIAEAKMERFIHEVLGQREWVAPELEAAKAWADRKDLDPIGRIEREARPSPRPAHDPIGIRFKERMTGFHADPENDGVTIAERSGAQLDLEPFGKAERTGIETSATIGTELTARIEDLALFLERSRQGQSTRIHVGGKVILSDLSLARPLECAIAEDRRSYFELQPAPAPVGEQARELYYELHFPRAGEEWVLRGRKLVRDEESFDIWEDTATLYFELAPAGATRVRRRGILRLPASAFFGQQLKSFKVTGTKDNARQIWALLAFGQFFFGQLVDVYVPELGGVAAILKGMRERMHV